MSAARSGFGDGLLAGAAALVANSKTEADATLAKAKADRYASAQELEWDARGLLRELRAVLLLLQLRVQLGQPVGDCIDCLQCVHVCPTGVDIRNGIQLGCIQCGLCIDACDNVMARIGRPARIPTRCRRLTTPMPESMRSTTCRTSSHPASCCAAARPEPIFTRSRPGRRHAAAKMSL